MNSSSAPESESEARPAGDLVTDRENLDPRETRAFDRLASRWWDPEGEFRPLHDINGPRADWIEQRAALDGAALLDVGCGGGLLTEAMAERGARVTGIDRAGKALKVAQLHRIESGLEVDYREVTAEALAAESPGAYDVVTCLEMLEHVPEPASVVRACFALARPGGQLFFSTINRSPLAWATAIVGAEYLLQLLPRGTHRYDRLIRPSELAGFVRAAGGDVVEIAGMHYNPFSRSVRIDGRPRVNYLLHARKPEA
ncbi:bifunctional 2-polyprenyl-6-hydroxyphenol methylase/3-demethylubiquinol 3-O-methyltransferase UbiG [Wenzhouxiangella sp. XN79A]|uniref:bifunctional 2-polyprenyl-6-hydroxyphenol methylase/3-demethylubiquinol 3-O-methyltransferase UbiG n=1 Tax=Wenzhouxiangella sp. XN79A TaxID=2724193 RepID=UPI00144AA589|nr:bifunctional 2-polyprenyl-6-hydroxyphenol methylase/3-demethylubiquinol 3-O-methyltransferase UbiG [Wenzhouxiangella sp. XN79A]NKI36019.1 bifunctional 2-polyprenyl-6-hydroxyphenol methylase/3-demethylubiquinol 3-O-methyltransferase UbiG [Wenzhouxiangella sp. XN79A]